MTRRLAPPGRLGPLLLAAVAALALGAPRGAGAAEGDPDLAPEDLALLPVPEIARDYLVRDHPGLVMRLEVLRKRAERIGRHLADREDRTDDAARALAADLETLREQVRPLVADLRRVLPGYGVPDDAFARAAAAPPGALREERFAHALVLEAPGADAEAAALLARVVPVADGALLAIQARRAKAERAPDGPGRAAALADAEEEQRGIERRFWRTVDVLLDDAPKAWVRRRLPGRLSTHADLLGHLFRLPELTPAQGVRLKSLLVELEAEVAPDTSEAQRADAELAAEDLPEARRRELEAGKRAAYARATGAKIAAYERGRAVLTEAQFEALMAIPPAVTAEDRFESPKAMLARMTLTPAQALALADLARAHEADRRRIEAEALRVQRAQQDMGPDSPQQDETMMAYAAIQARAGALVRQATREAFLRILRPDQVVGWVVGLER